MEYVIISLKNLKVIQSSPKALEVYKEGNHSFIPKTLFNLAHVKAKQAEWSAVDNLYLRDETWLKNSNSYDLANLNAKGLYLIHDVDLIRESFKFFKDNGLYADMEDYGVIAAEV
ncbi:hypothetical protein PO124_17785 [Bacillus licheniformis]|nr:hypothetical protein [Bacillus licheniformis]